jgi:hypothetical protein
MRQRPAVRFASLSDAVPEVSKLALDQLHGVILGYYFA